MTLALCLMNAFLVGLFWGKTDKESKIVWWLNVIALGAGVLLLVLKGVV